MYLLVCVSSHTPVTMLSELQCYLSGVSHVSASIYKCIYVYIVYCIVAIFIGCVIVESLYVVSLYSMIVDL